MSDKNDVTVDDILAEAEERKSLSEMERKVKKARLKKQLAELEESEANQASLDKLDVRVVSPEQLNRMDQEHDLMVKSLSYSLPLISPGLTEFVGFSYPSLFFVGAKSGQGKSTFAANAIYNMMMQKPEGGSKKKNILLLTNEEMSLSVYNRIACLHKGWNVDRMKLFTPEQHDEVRRIRNGIASRGIVRVVDSTYDGVKGATTTYEGLVAVLENIYSIYKAKKELDPEAEADYGMIVLDFYNKVSSSIKNPTEPSWSVLTRVSNYLDEFYKKYPAPVLVFGQLKPDTDDETADGFEYRIKDSKSIFVPATTALELKAFKKERRTAVIMQKNRWGANQGESINLHQKEGKFIDFSLEYQIEIARSNEEKAHKELMKSVNLKND